MPKSRPNGITPGKRVAQGIRQMRERMELRGYWRFFLAHQDAVAARKGTVAQYRTGSQKNYERYGRRFLEYIREGVLFSPVGSGYYIEKSSGMQGSQHAIRIRFKNKIGREETIALMELGFDEEALVIESMKTAETKYAGEQLAEFRRLAEEHPFDRMLHTAEKAARKEYFNEIRIRRPETLHDYHYPSPASRLAVEETRKNMRTLYDRIAIRNGYTKGDYYYIKTI